MVWPGEPWPAGPPAPWPLPEVDLDPLPSPRYRYRLLGRRRTRHLWAKLALGTTLPLVVVVAALGATRPWSPRAQRHVVRTAPVPTAHTTATVIGYEAEDSSETTLGPHTRVRDVPGASGGKVVTDVGHGTPAGDVTFREVAAAVAGRYTVTVYYLLADTVAHRLALWVDGRGPTILSFPPPVGGAIGALRVTVPLAAGTNTVRFSNATAKYGPDLDRITVAPQQP